MWDTFDEYGPWWGDSINRGIDVLGAYASRSPYYSPDDPRFRNGGAFPQATNYNYATRTPAGAAPGAVNFEGIQVNWWTLVLGGALVGAFLFGRKGR